MTVRVRFSTRQDGDFHLEQDRAVLDGRRRSFVDLPWTQAMQVHGVDVAHVSAPGDADGVVADALVTDCADAVLGIWVGDCAPLALLSDDGRLGAVHAGWRGVEHGVVAAAVGAVRCDPAARVDAVLGPCIHPCCNEFGEDDLRRLAVRFGDGVIGRTGSGRPAFDLPAAIEIELARLGVRLVDRSTCTGCRPDLFFSHRVRGERERQVMAVWMA